MEDGSVNRNTIPSDLEKVRRNSSIFPAAALREMEGSVADPMATPNNPRGSCMNRNAYPSQLTGPSYPRTGSEIPDARFVLTATLISTAAFPKIAGPIMRRIRCKPGCDQSKAAWKRYPSLRRLGNCQHNCS